MRLSELMSNSGLAFWPQVALVIFLVVFAAVVVRVFSKKRRQEYEEASRLPLDSERV